MFFWDNMNPRKDSSLYISNIVWLVLLTVYLISERIQLRVSSRNENVRKSIDFTETSLLSLNYLDFGYLNFSFTHKWINDLLLRWMASENMKRMHNVQQN
jgi:hypothetical protein